MNEVRSWLNRGPAVAAVAASAIAVALAPLPVSGHTVGAAPQPPDPVSLLLEWTLDPVPVAGLLLAAAVYVGLVRRGNRLHAGHPWPVDRSAAFLGGLGFLAVALLSPIDTISADLASVHMIQHMLLMQMAPPLLAAGAPVTTLLRAASPRARGRVVLPFLHSRLVGVVTHPVVAWVVLAAVLWGTHYSAIYNAALLDENTHIAEHLLYLTAACLFWWPVFSPDPVRRRLATPIQIAYVLLQMPQMSFLAVTIMEAPRLLYPAYLNRSLVYGIDPLVDQQASGALMWVGGDMMFLMAAAVLVRRWMRESERAAVREDARLDRLARASATAGPEATGEAP